MRTRTSNRVPTGAPRRGFTLIEVIVSSAITLILALAVGSVVILAARVMPRASAGTIARVEEASNRALELLASDIALAVEIPYLSKNALTLSVPDRDGDGDLESISYEWDGVEGSPLTRSINASDPTPIVESVSSLTFTPETVTRTNVEEGAATTSGEVLLASYTGTANTQEKVQATQWHALVFPVTLPDGATAYSISRIDLYISRVGVLAGADHLELRHAWPDGTPASTPIASVSMPAGILALAAGWQSFTPVYSGSNVLTSRFLSMVLAHDSGSSVLTVYKTVAAVAGHREGESANSGTTWTMSDGSWAYRVYGRVVTIPTSTTISTHVRAVAIDLTPVGSAAPQRRVVRTASEPATP